MEPNPPNKAFWVTEDGSDWGAFLHAPTAGKAKTRFIKEFGLSEVLVYTDLRAGRLPKMDTLPFTGPAFREAEYNGYMTEDGEPQPDGEYTDFCGCPICKEAFNQKLREELISAKEARDHEQ